MAKAFGIITSSAEHKVDGLQDYRPIGSFSFLGRYRVIDFPISNLSNSGIINQQVYIASKARSLVAHIGTGRHYNINSKRGRIQLLLPSEQKVNAIYNTNIQAMYENLEYIKRQSQEYVVIALMMLFFRATLLPALTSQLCITPFIMRRAAMRPATSSISLTARSMRSAAITVMRTFVLSPWSPSS